MISSIVIDFNLFFTVLGESVGPKFAGWNVIVGLISMHLLEAPHDDGVLSLS